MAYDLFDITYMVARELGVIREGVATGGSTTTIIDTTNLLDKLNDDHFNQGTAWIIQDQAGAGAAPEGEYAKISDFVKATGTITMGAVTVAVAAGDRYAAATAEYTLDTLIAYINAALAHILVRTEDVTLTTASAQTEYTLPSAILDEGIEVLIQRITTDANDNRWTPWSDWYISQGATKQLIFRTQPPYAYSLKIVYWLPHDPLYAVSDALNKEVNVNLVVLSAAQRLLEWKLAQKGQNDPYLAARLTNISERLAIVRRAHPLPRRRPKLAMLGKTDNMTVQQ